jgi:gamma-glutamyl phosphate reductase
MNMELIGSNARKASREVALLTPKVKNQILLEVANLILKNRDKNCAFEEFLRL